MAKLVRCVAAANRWRSVGRSAGALRAICSQMLLKIGSLGANVTVRFDWISRIELPLSDTPWTIRSSSA